MWTNRLNNLVNKQFGNTFFYDASLLTSLAHRIRTLSMSEAAHACGTFWIMNNISFRISVPQSKRNFRRLL